MTGAPTVNEDDRVELLPCPFCGNGAERIVFGKGRADERLGVRCADLTCGGMVRLGTQPGESVTLWNTRASLQGADTVTDAMGDGTAQRLLRRATEAHTRHFNPGVFEHEKPEFEDSDDLFEALLYDARMAAGWLEALAAPPAQDDTGARLDAVWDELQSLLPQSGVGAELQSAWDRLRCLINVSVREGVSGGGNG